MKQNIPTEIESLLKEKSFSALSEIEREEVERFLDPKEYEAMRRIILQSMATFHDEGQGLAISPAIEDSLIKTFKEKTIQKHSYSFREALGNIFNYRIPMYRVAIAVVLLLVAVNFLEPGGSASNEMVAADTVYIEIPTQVQLTESQINQRKMDLSEAAREVITEVKNIVKNAPSDIASSKPAQKFQHELVKTDKIVKNFASNFDKILENNKKGKALKEDSVINRLLLN